MKEDMTKYNEFCDDKRRRIAKYMDLNERLKEALDAKSKSILNGTMVSCCDGSRY